MHIQNIYTAVMITKRNIDGKENMVYLEHPFQNLLPMQFPAPNTFSFDCYFDLCNIADSDIGKSVKVSLTNIDGEIAKAEFDLDSNKVDNETRSSEFLLPFRNIVFRKSGSYSIHIVVDGMQTRNVSFEVR